MSQSITINACTWSIHYIIKTPDYTWIITKKKNKNIYSLI